ncbi:MAG: hypothetical protein NC033_04830 [Clostridiales bacterium]|nr:hypothetical protein [Clostridiales bacterium]
MPKLHIDDTDFEFTIVQYEKDLEYRWSKIKIGIHNYYMNFERVQDYWEKWEVDFLIQELHKFLDGDMTENEEVSGTEPDISFKFYPSNGEFGGYLDFSFNFQTESGAYSDEIWTISLYPQEARQLLAELEYEKQSTGGKI